MSHSTHNWVIYTKMSDFTSRTEYKGRPRHSITPSEIRINSKTSQMPRFAHHLSHTSCAMTRSYVWNKWLIFVTWLIRMCDMTHWYLWRDSFICVTWLIHMCDMTHEDVLLRTPLVAHPLCHDSFVRVRWMIHVWGDSFMRVTLLIYKCDEAHSYVWHDSWGCLASHTTCRTPPVSWLIHMCDMCSYV